MWRVSRLAAILLIVFVAGFLLGDLAHLLKRPVTLAYSQGDHKALDGEFIDGATTEAQTQTERILQARIETLQRELASRLQAGEAGNEGESESHADGLKTSLEQRKAKEECDRWIDGQLAFKPDETMKEGVATLVEARLARGHDKQILEGLKNGSEQSVPVTCAAQVQLRAVNKEEFEIVADDPTSDGQTARFLSQDIYERWAWKVTPLKHGKDLHLVLSVVPLISGSPGLLPSRIHPFDRIITVSANRPYELKKSVTSAWGMFGGGAFCAGGMGFLGSAAWKRFNQRKRKPDSPKPWERLG